MKQDKTVFTCDSCKKEETILAKTGFPYEKGWCYFYNFSGKYLNAHYIGIETDIEQFQEKDRHFCSTKCMIEFIRKRLKLVKRPIDPLKIKECLELVGNAKVTRNNR